jgi:hypothetical protein
MHEACQILNAAPRERKRPTNSGQIDLGSGRAPGSGAAKLQTARQELLKK